MTTFPTADRPATVAGDERTSRRLARLRRDLRRSVREQRRRWRYRITRGRVEFDREVHALHAQFRQGLPAYLRGANPLSLLTAPVIYSLLVPFALIDAWVTVYQRICFPIYGIPLVRRRPYFALDRRKLRYLNAIEKANCTFCTYANGVLSRVREVAARTEQYWCPIKHARPIPSPHERYHQFFDYGDAASYHQQLAWQRQRLRPTAAPATARRSRGKR
jgi:hypothetical protein